MHPFLYVKKQYSNTYSTLFLNFKQSRDVTTITKKKVTRAKSGGGDERTCHGKKWTHHMNATLGPVDESEWTCRRDDLNNI
jgi:hypothetical protein